MNKPNEFSLSDPTGRARVSSPTARDNASVAIDTFSRIARGAVWWLRPKANSVIGTGSGRVKPCKIKPLLYARQQNGRRYLHTPLRWIKRRTNPG